ncbi:MAG: glutamate synthase subunit alpha, partial [Solirubrobacteraceae bacterium]|nr:glutamate synthase subunit alpha [Solirubrobacteraceae bacterium]
VNFFFFVAEELRGIMASLGIRTMNEMIGRTELLQADDAITHWKASGLDLTHLLAFPNDVDPSAPRYRVEGPPPVLGDHLDWGLVDQAKDAINAGEPVVLQQAIRNLDRCTGGILSSHVAARYGQAGLPDNTIQVNFTGSAGQSFGGWLAHGVTFSLEGDANDYVGKGLSGGVLSVRPPADATYVPEDNVIVGNTLLYGATEGRAFIRGKAGERFAVRNSGANAVVEGVGDHGCEYMTGGRVVVLGGTGRNFAAGMSGGLAFVYDPEGTFGQRVNPTMLDQLEELSSEDQDELRSLLEEHVQRTGSTVAEGILSRFDEAVSDFVKIFPTDYKRVLAERAAAAAGTTGGAA